jgi:hypothetical protein
MKAQPFVVLDPSQKVFAVTVRLLQPSTPKMRSQGPLGDIFKEPFALHLDPNDGLMQGGGVQISTKDFNIGKLWHGDRPPSS